MVAVKGWPLFAFLTSQCWGQWPEATLTGHPSRPPSQRLSVNRDTARESVIQIWEVSSASRAMMVMIYGCEGSMSNCDDHHLALMVTRGVGGGHLSIIATAHIRNVWKLNIILKILLLVQNTHCNISTISVNIGFGLWQEKSPKNFIYWQKVFCIVQRSRIIFQSIKIKIRDASYHYPNHIIRLQVLKSTQIFYRKILALSAAVVPSITCNCKTGISISIGWKFCIKISLQYLQLWEFEWKKGFTKVGQCRHCGINENILAFHNSSHLLLYWSHWLIKRQDHRQRWH